MGRHGRMCWFLVQTKGPRNANIDPDRLTQIQAVCVDAGIPEAAIIDPIKSIIQTGKWSRQVGDQEVVFDDIGLPLSGSWLATDDIFIVVVVRRFQCIHQSPMIRPSPEPSNDHTGRGVLALR